MSKTLLDCSTKEENHDFRYLYSAKKKEDGGYRRYVYTRTDFFYCTKCLREEQTIRTTTSDSTPGWYEA